MDERGEAAGDGEAARDGEARDRSVTRRRVLGGALAAGALVVVGGVGLAVAGRDDGDAVDESAPAPPRLVAYGPAALQRGALSVPPGHGAGSEPIPVVVLVHGGFWSSAFDRTLMEPLAEAVVAEGWAAWNLDHRSSDDGGGWPTTFTDVAAGLDHVAEMADEWALDPGRVAILGHSAGGTLALWAAGRRTLPAGAPGADPVVRPVGVVAYAAVTSLVSASLDGLGGGAVDELMGGPPTADHEDDYLLASPSDRLPLDTPQLIVHGEDDPLVPLRQSTAHAARAEAAGDEVRLVVLPATDHLDPLDPATEAWAETGPWLRDRLRR